MFTNSLNRADAEGIAVEPAERHSQEVAKLMQPAMEKGGPNHWIMGLGKAKATLEISA